MSELLHVASDFDDKAFTLVNTTLDRNVLKY